MQNLVSPSSQKDKIFRGMCKAWYDGVEDGTIISTNFQLYPPRGWDTNIIRNTYGNLVYPLLFCAERRSSGFEIVRFEPEVLEKRKLHRCLSLSFISNVTSQAPNAPAFVSEEHVFVPKEARLLTVIL